MQHAVGEGVVVLGLRVVDRGALDRHLVGRKLALQCADQVGQPLDDRERVDEVRSPHIAPELWRCSDGTCSTFELVSGLLVKPSLAITTRRMPNACARRLSTRKTKQMKKLN